MNKSIQIYAKTLAKIATETAGYNHLIDKVINKHKQRKYEILEGLNEALKENDIIKTKRYCESYEKMHFWALSKVSDQKPMNAKDLLDKAVEIMSKYVEVDNAYVSMELPKSRVPEYFLQINGDTSRSFRIKL